MAADDVKPKTSFRLKKNEDDIEDHEGRITRLERGGLIIGGYLLAEGSQLITHITELL